MENEFITDDTIQTGWQGLTIAPLSLRDLSEIRSNLVRYFEVLSSWDSAVSRSCHPSESSRDNEGDS
jgi:hypothetical protein